MQAATSHPARSRQRGFTLIEAVIVMTLIGVVAAMIGVFIARPIDAYVDLARRAELSDDADTALKHLARDVAPSLPNSVRVGGSSGQFLEFLPVFSSGRYRAAPAADGSGDFFNVDDASDNSFDSLGVAPVVPASGPGYLAIYNLGIPGADAYNADTIRPLTTTTNANPLTYDVSGGQFPYPSPGNRYQVITTPVTYVCAPGAAGTGSLRRYTGYAIQSSQPTDVSASPLAGLSGLQNSLVADHVETCSFSYTPTASARTALLTIRLTLSSKGEKLTFVQQVHVDNSP